MRSHRGQGGELEGGTGYCPEGPATLREQAELCCLLSFAKGATHHRTATYTMYLWDDSFLTASFLCILELYTTEGPPPPPPPPPPLSWDVLSGPASWFREESLREALDIAQKVLPAYESMLQVPFALPKLDLVAIPDFAAGAMENWGLITYRETALLLDPQQASIADKRYVASVVAHEMAHQVYKWMICSTVFLTDLPL